MVRHAIGLVALIVAIGTWTDRSWGGNFCWQDSKQQEAPSSVTSQNTPPRFAKPDHSPAWNEYYVDSSLTPGLYDAEIRDGWLSLFDGKSLYGWRSESKANWTVQNGEVQADAGEVGLLRTTTQFGDYELKLEFRAEADTNSGVFLRTSPQPKNPAADCYELNIAPSENPFPTGSFVGRLKSETAVTIPDRDTWHHLHVLNESGHFEVSIDGKRALTFDDPQPLGRGYIGLQYNQGFVAFRNIALKPLGLQPIFDGKTLEGWDVGNQSESQFRVTGQSELHLTGGRGQIETKSRFGDFGLTLECKTGAANLNSGVFFRCIPGQLMNGYESQIHNGVQGGDATKPVDFGTGGIFRRETARRVVSRDLEWFRKTIFATGPHVAVWVNGYLVCDWTDTREPDENPRNGKRLDAGTIILQGHDPTTDILFRQLQASELPPRRATRNRPQP